MDIKKVLLISVITVVILASVSIVSAGLFDGLFDEQQKDNVIEIDGITFNTTNATDFKENSSFLEESSNDYVKVNGYQNNNSTGDYYVIIIDYDEFAGSYEDMDREVMESFKNGLLLDNTPYQTINGVVVYTGSKISGEDVGKPVHISLVQNADLNKIIAFASPDANETAKMVSTLDFK